MPSNVNEINYELIDENVNLYVHNDLNKLTIAENENLNHFSTKAILFYVLTELNHDVICDFHIIGVGNVDLYDFSTRTVYLFDPSMVKGYQETLNELYEQSEVEMISINIEDFPDDIFQRYLKLREYIMPG